MASTQDALYRDIENVRTSLRPGAPVLIVINDRRELYPEILERAGSSSRSGSAGT